MNWTEAQAREYMQKRLKDEQRTRTELYANHHPSEVSAAVTEPHPGPTLVAPAHRETPGSTGSLQRAKITYIVRAVRPCDFDNWNIKFLQDCLVAAGILDDDNWQILSGQIISEKAATKEDEGVTVIIESL
ncbi:MAG: hypothetical protein V4563_14955 [Pseudomonadota bacterium]